MNRFKYSLWTVMVSFFALLGVNIYAVSNHELVVEQNNQCMVINLLKDAKQVGRVELLYQDQANAKCEIKEQPAVKNKTPRVVRLNKDVPRPSLIKATREFAKNRFAQDGFVVESIKDNTVVKLSLQDNKNTLEAEINSNGVIKIEHGQLEDKFIVSGQYAQVLIPKGKTLRAKNLTFDVHTLLNDGLIRCNTGSFGATYLFENKGTLITLGDCVLRMPKSFFRNTGYEGLGVLEVKGNLLFEGDGSTFDNKAGTVIVYKNAEIKANRFINERLPKIKEEDKPLTTFQECKTDDGIKVCNDRVCENSHEIAGSGASFFKCYGKFTLVTDYGVNKQSVIHADGAISITATDFENQQDELIKQWCKLTKIRLEFMNFTKVDRDSSSTLLPALITCGDSIEFLLRGRHYTHVRGVLSDKQVESLPGLTNSGHIRAQENIVARMHSDTAEDHIARVFNGPKTTVHKPTPNVKYKGEMVSLVPNNIPKAAPEAQVSPKNPYFKHVSSINEVSHPVGMNEIVFRQGVLPKLKPTSKSLFSYQLQAQLLTQILYEQITTSFLNHVNNDALAQFAFLKEMGFLYGLVHGLVRELPNVPKSDISVFISDYDKQRLKEALRLFADKNQKTTLGNLEKRLKQVRAGTHILVLSEDKIISAPQSFLYYDCSKEGDIIPHVHISKEDFESNAENSGKIQAKNVFLHTPIVVNTGSIVAFNKVEIKAQSFKNIRPVHKKINSHTTQDIWGSYHTYQYEIRTPQPGGQVLGFIVEVEVPEAGNGSQFAGHKGIQNKGGTIEGTCKVLLVSKQGNIENRHVLGTKTISLDHGFLASASGKPSKSLAHDFHAGQISSSQGDVELVAETGKVLNIASDIIAAKNVKLKGYGDVLLKTLTQPHAILSGSQFSGVTYQEMEAEGFAVGLGRVIAHEGDVILESKNVVENEGAYTQSGKDTLYDGQKGNKIHTAKATTKTTLYEASLLYPPKAKTIVTEHLIQPEMKAGGKLEFLTELDNVIEAVIMTETGAIYVTAGRDNILKGGQAKTTINEHKFTIGINFFGKQALEKLWAEDPNAAVWSLAEEDPLVQSLLALAVSAKEGDVAGATSETFISAFEAARLLVNYKAQAKAAGANFSKTGFVGQRLGVTDAQGNFDPRIRVRFGYTNTATNHIHDKQTTIKTKTFEAKSGRDTQLADGTKVEAKDVHLDVKGDFKTSPATSTTHTEVIDTGIHVDATLQGVAAAGVSASTTSTHEQKHDQAEFKANNVRIDVAGDFNQRGTTIEGNDTRINVGGDFVGESVQDTLQEQSHVGEVTVGLSGSLSGSYNQGSKNKAQTEQISSVSGTENLEINVNGNIKTQGFLFESESSDSRIKAQSIKPGTLQDCDDVNTFGISGSTTYPNSGPDGIHTVIYPSIGYLGDDGITQTTVAGPIKLETEEPAPYINRDKSQMRLKGKKTVSRFRMVIPVVKLQRLLDTLQELQCAETPAKKVAIWSEAEPIIDESTELVFQERIEESSKEPEVIVNEKLDSEADGQSVEVNSQSESEQPLNDINQNPEQFTLEKDTVAYDKFSQQEDLQTNEPGQQQQTTIEDQIIDQPFVVDFIEEKTGLTNVVVAIPNADIDIRKAVLLANPTLNPVALKELVQKLKAQKQQADGYSYFKLDFVERELGLWGLTLADVKEQVIKYVSTIYTSYSDGEIKNFSNFPLKFDKDNVIIDGVYIDNNLYFYEPMPPLQEPINTGAVASFILDLLPVIGNAKMAFEAGVAYDYITQEEVGPWGRVFRAGGALLPLAGRLKSLGNLKYFKTAKHSVKAFLSEIKLGKYLRAAQPGFIDISKSSSSKLANSVRKMLDLPQNNFTNKKLKEELELLTSRSTGIIKDLNIEELFTRGKINHIFNKAKHHLELLNSDVEEIAYKLGKELIRADEVGLTARLTQEGVNLIVDGYEITVLGTILNGKMRWGTIYIPHAIGRCPKNPCPFVKLADFPK